MLESLMTNVGDLNVQIPVGYVLTAAAVAFGVYWTIKKMFMLAKLVVVGILARFSLAMLGSGGLFLAGLAGVGNSAGTMLENSENLPRENQVSFIDKQAVRNVITRADQNPSGNEARKMAFEYAKEQDKRFGNQPVYISTEDTKVNKEVKGESKSTPTSYMMLTTSLGMILIGIVWMLRRWNE